VHEFQDAYLVDGSIFLSRMARIELRSSVERSGLRRFSLLPMSPEIEVDDAVLVAGVAGSTWFGHWLEDEVPLQILASSFGLPIAHVRAEYLHERKYRELLTLEHPMRVGTARVSRLKIVEEFAQNPSKARRYWRIRSQLARTTKTAVDRVFLNRGSTGTSRTLTNEAQLVARFRAEGFTIVDMATSSLSEILQDLIGASLVVGVEGSHLAHALYTIKDFGQLVILAPAHRAYTTVADIAPFCRIHASMYICTPENDGSFSANIDELLAFIDEATKDRKRRLGGLERFTNSLSSYPAEYDF
jgi:capsular polysaccharide biosynthesis protein